MPDYVYLDSNSFWNLKPEHSLYDQEFAAAVRRLQRRYRFPFSEAHFLDIALGDVPGNESYIERDLTFLAEASQGQVIALDHNKRMPPEKFLPVLGPMPGDGLPWIVHHDYPLNEVAELYRCMLKDAPTPPSFLVSGPSHQVDLSQIPDHHPMKPLLEMAGGVFAPEVLKKYMDILWEGRDAPDVYKEFRKSVEEACQSIGSEGRLLAPEAAETFAPLRALMAAETTEEISLKLGSAAEILAFLGGQKFNDLPWPARLVNSYHLLAFHTKMWEKINKDNRPPNMRYDAKHLIYAAGAKHFVTNDKRFAAKAKVVFSAFGIKTKVSGISEFKNLFS